MSKLSSALRAKVQSGDAHWVTIKEGPLEGRHLLIDGPRPTDGKKSSGRILAGHGIPLHVIQKITGASNGSQVETHQTMESHILNHLQKLRGYEKLGNFGSKFIHDMVHKYFTSKGPMGEDDSSERVLVGVNPTNGKHTFWNVKGSIADKSDEELAKYYGRYAGYGRMEWVVVHRDMKHISPVYNSKGQIVDTEAKKASAEAKNSKLHAIAEKLQSKLQKFGIAAVEFNKVSASDRERERVAKVAEKAFDVMSQLVPSKALTKTRIKVVLGKLEHSKNAWAYYLPSRRSIYLTSKENGMKPFYHEYGHALDHAIGDGSWATETGVLKPLIDAIRETTAHQQFIGSIGNPGSPWRTRGQFGLRYFQSGKETFARWFAVYVQRQAKIHNVELPSELAEGDRFEKYSDGEMIHLSRIFEDILDKSGLSKMFVLGGMLLVKKESKPKVNYSNPSKGISHELRARVKVGDAHWITVKKGPLEGRHLLIEGPRPEPGKQSTGRILAGRGIPNHVIEKLAGTHASDVEHVQTHHDADGMPSNEVEMFHKPHQSGFSNELGIDNTDSKGFTQTSFINGADEKPKPKTKEEREAERKRNAELDRQNKEFWDNPQKSQKTNVDEKDHHWYTYRLRGLSPGAQPRGHVEHDESIGRHGAIAYDRELTQKELDDYELNPYNNFEHSSDSHDKNIELAIRGDAVKPEDGFNAFSVADDAGIDQNKYAHVYVTQNGKEAKIGNAKSSGRFVFAQKPFSSSEIAKHGLTPVDDEERAKIAVEHHQKKNGNVPMVLSNKNGTKGSVITPSARHNGKFQVTHFDHKGFISDSTHETMNDAVKRAFEHDHSIPNQDLLDKMMQNPEFHLGNKQTSEKQSKKIHDMSNDEMENHIMSHENKFEPTKYTVDWGSRPRGQGRRRGRQVMGGMSDITLQGKKEYLNRFGNLPDYDDKQVQEDTRMLNRYRGEDERYLRARTAGLDHENAMRFAWATQENGNGYNAIRDDLKSKSGSKVKKSMLDAFAYHGRLLIKRR